MMLRINCFAVLNLLCIFNNTTFSQNIDEVFGPREHASKDGKSKITLKFKSLVGNELTVISPEGEEVDVKLSIFDRKSQAWFKQAERFRKQYVARAEQLASKSDYLIGTNAQRKLFYRLLLENQEVGWVVQEELLAASKSTENPLKERFKAICGFALVAKPTKENFNELLGILLEDAHPLHGLVTFHPEEFLPSLGRYGSNGELYLWHVASVGKLALPAVQGQRIGEHLRREPIGFDQSNGNANRFRIGAILGFAHLENSKKIEGFLHRLLSAAIKYGDQNLIKATLYSIGMCGCDSISIQNRLDNLKSKYPNEVEMVRSRLKAKKHNEKKKANR